MKRPSVLNRILMALVFLFLYAPIFVLIVFSFNQQFGDSEGGNGRHEYHRYARQHPRQAQRQNYLPKHPRRAGAQ